MLEVALVTGISGQDGSLLSKILVENNYTVVGLVRNKEIFTYDKLKYLSIEKEVIIEQVDLLNYDELHKLFIKYNPTKVFNFASQSSVGLSYSLPRETLEFNIQSVVNILECIRVYDRGIRFFQASSSEIFGNVRELPVNEETPINPVNLYAISKATCHSIIEYYRKQYNIFVSSAIFMNHESVFRGNNFIIKKVIRDLIKVKNKEIKNLVVGNIDTMRDFGSASKYMEAVYKMLQVSQCDDFVISSGKSYAIKEIINYVLDNLSLEWSTVQFDKKLYRENDLINIYGDSSKANKILDWHYNESFFSVLDQMIAYEKNQYKIR